MKVTNWRRKIASSLVAAGILVPSAASAVDIPLLDPSFENHVVVPFDQDINTTGYAYADLYRFNFPISDWVDDLNSPTSYAQDDANSNWLYNADYAELGSTARKRAAPRTGDQAMHGGGNYSAQVSTGVFEAGKSYTFSVWAQGDDDSTLDSSRVWMYIFNGAQLFSEADSLQVARYAPDSGDFVNRAVGDTPAQSQAKWQQISITHHVFNDAPEIGAPVGVAFWGAGDAGVDDASLSADPISDFLMVLEVNTTNGQTRLRNQTGEDIYIDYYEIESASLSLNSTTWNSLQDQDSEDFPAGDGSGNGWEESGGSTGTSTRVLAESFLTGNSAVDEDPVALGAAFKFSGGTQDLIFRYAQVAGSGAADGDHNLDGVVDAADYVFWRDTLGDTPNYNLWKENFGATGGVPTGPGTLTRGYVSYVTSFSGSATIPEPSSVVLVGIGLAGIAAVGLRRRKNDE
jgi:hypothetical protein